MDGKATAAQFDAQTQPLSSSMFAGTDYSAVDSLKVSIAPRLPSAVLKDTSAAFQVHHLPLAFLCSRATASPLSRPPCPQDIGREYWRKFGKGKREWRQNLVMVGQHAVLRQNMYDMQQASKGCRQVTWPGTPGCVLQCQKCACMPGRAPAKLQPQHAASRLHPTFPTSLARGQPALGPLVDVHPFCVSLVVST